MLTKWVRARKIHPDVRDEYFRAREAGRDVFDLFAPPAVDELTDDLRPCDAEYGDDDEDKTGDVPAKGRGKKKARTEKTKVREPKEACTVKHGPRTIDCNTEKGVPHERKWNRSAGAIYYVYNCGVCFFVWELFGSEGLRQVYYSLRQMLSLAMESGHKLPMSAAYDDACHLVLFLMRRQGMTATAALLTAIDWVIDRFHYDNHT